MSLSHLRERKFKYNFQDTLDPFCNCCLDIETTVQYFLHCHNYNHQRQILLDSLLNIDTDPPNLNENLLTDMLLFGNPKYNSSLNYKILTASISYILSTKRFEKSLIE